MKKLLAAIVLGVLPLTTVLAGEAVDHKPEAIGMLKKFGGAFTLEKLL